ncbi:MAG: M23 family metallopeptidase [Pseudonocardiaceae bacterium]
MRTSLLAVLLTALLAAPTAAASNWSAPGPDEGGAVPAFGWPLPGFPAVVRDFDPPAHRYGPGHRGVDLAGVHGLPVLAAGAGTVVYAGPLAGRGVVSIDHPGGLRTTYEPVLAAVSAGELVARGQRIGTLEAGHPGCTAPACLHWGLRRGIDYLDPLRLLAPGRLRLLPWQGAAVRSLAQPAAVRSLAQPAVAS